MLGETNADLVTLLQSYNLHHICCVVSSYNNAITFALNFVSKKGHPKMIETKHDGTFSIKCTAKGNHYAPQISWKLNDDLEIVGKL